MPSAEQLARLAERLKAVNARRDAAMPAGEPYVSPYVTEGFGLYTEEDRAAMRAAERFGQASAANMEDLERSVNEAAARGVTLKPAPNRRRRP